MMDEEFVIKMADKPLKSYNDGHIAKLHVLADLLDTVHLNLLSKFVTLEQIKYAVRVAYDKYIEPIDLPFVDEKLEKQLDELLEEALLLVVEMLWLSMTEQKNKSNQNGG
jgi:hypothetical protein